MFVLDEVDFYEKLCQVYIYYMQIVLGWLYCSSIFFIFFVKQLIWSWEINLKFLVFLCSNVYNSYVCFGIIYLYGEIEVLLLDKVEIGFLLYSFII